MLTTPIKKMKQKNGRTPLQLKNIPANPITDDGVKSKGKGKSEWIEISLTGKENYFNVMEKVEKNNKDLEITQSTNNDNVPIKIESFDSSLAEELGVIRKKLERLRLEKERTEKMLREMDLVLDMEMKEMEMRGKMQKELEMEVVKLQRLNELRSFCMVSESDLVEMITNSTIRVSIYIFQSSSNFLCFVESYSNPIA